jgi:hypothetical protein
MGSLDFLFFDARTFEIYLHALFTEGVTRSIAPMAGQIS